MQDVISWLKGDLTTAGRIWGAIAPALLLGSYFFGGLLIYMFRVVLKGGYRDAEIEARGSSALIGMRARNFFAWVMRPIWGLLQRAQVPPNAVTTLSVLLACAAGVSVAVGRFALGGWLYLFAGACDFIDGRLARVTGKASPAGAALDSVLDRYAESAILVGLAWFYRDSWVLLAVLVTLVGSHLVPYVRARGEGLGVDVKVGLMQRPERLVLLGATVAFSPIIEAWLVPLDTKPIHRLAVLGIVILAAATQLTAAQRLAHVLGKLDPRTAATFKRATDRGGIARNIIAALVATGVDFLMVTVLVSLASADPRLATALGCVVGGVTNFAINRIWTFGSTAPAIGQAWRYGFVSASSALLNSGGVAILLFLPALDYRLAWIIVRGAVFLAWNYPLHRDYVFSDEPDGIEQPHPSTC